MIAVVAGVVRREGRVLLCQRPEGKRFGLLWEFPGGKVEAGETPEAALERELREELDVQTRTGRVLDALRMDSRDGGDLLLLFYESEIVRGEPRTVECRALDWALPEGRGRIRPRPGGQSVFAAAGRSCLARAEVPPATVGRKNCIFGRAGLSFAGRALYNGCRKEAWKWTLFPIYRPSYC